MVHHNPES
jgi:antitoxin ParD1/3/4